MPLVLLLGDRRVTLDRPLVLGAGGGCDVVVPGLAARHAKFQPSEAWTLVHAEGEGPVSVGEVRVAPGESRALVPGDRLRLGPLDAEVAHEETVAPAGTAGLALAAIRRAREAPRVLVVGGAALGAHLDLTVEGQPVRVGRGKDCDWVLEDTSLSRAHARLVLRHGTVLVRDLGASRGTFLGASRLEPQKDATWDQGRALRIGDTVLALLPPSSIDDVVGELACEEPVPAPAPGEPSAVETPSPGPRTGAAPLASAPVIEEVDVRRGSHLRTRVVMAIGVAFIVACVAVLLWVLGVFSSGR